MSFNNVVEIEANMPHAVTQLKCEWCGDESVSVHPVAVAVLKCVCGNWTDEFGQKAEPPAWCSDPTHPWNKP